MLNSQSLQYNLKSQWQTNNPVVWTSLPPLPIPLLPPKDLNIFKNPLNSSIRNRMNIFLLQNFLNLPEGHRFPFWVSLSSEFTIKFCDIWILFCESFLYSFQSPIPHEVTPIGSSEPETDGFKERILNIKMGLQITGVGTTQFQISSFSFSPSSSSQYPWGYFRQTWRKLNIHVLLWEIQRSSCNSDPSSSIW